MTNSRPLPALQKGTYTFSVLRILLCGLLMALICLACLYVQYTSLDFLHTQLLEQEKKTTAWFVEQLRFSLPFILICVFQTAIYTRHYRRDGIAQREMAWEVLLCAVLVYGVALPCLSELSEGLYHTALMQGEAIPTTPNVNVDITLLMELHEWFVRLSIPLAVLFIYHSARAYHEIKHPEELEEEIPLTVEEYEAMRAQAPLVEGVTLTAESPVEEDIPTAAPDPLGEAPHE